MSRRWSDAQYTGRYLRRTIVHGKGEARSKRKSVPVSQDENSSIGIGNNIKQDETIYPNRVSRKKKILLVGVLYVTILVAIIIYISYPTCLACGKKTRDTMTVGNIEVPWCKEHQKENQYNYSTSSTNDISVDKKETTLHVSEKAEETSQSKTTIKSDNIERPFYGMSERLINSTKVGTYSYKENSTVTPEGNGSSYTFIIDSRHAMLVKTADGIVVMVQYIEDGKKVLWSETSTGFHDWRH